MSGMDGLRRIDGSGPGAGKLEPQVRERRRERFGASFFSVGACVRTCVRTCVWERACVGLCCAALRCALPCRAVLPRARGEFHFLTLVGRVAQTRTDSAHRLESVPRHAQQRSTDSKSTLVGRPHLVLVQHSSHTCDKVRAQLEMPATVICTNPQQSRVPGCCANRMSGIGKISKIATRCASKKGRRSRRLAFEKKLEEGKEQRAAVESGARAVQGEGAVAGAAVHSCFRVGAAGAQKVTPTDTRCSHALFRNTPSPRHP